MTSPLITLSVPVEQIQENEYENDSKVTVLFVYSSLSYFSSYIINHKYYISQLICFKI